MNQIKTRRVGRVRGLSLYAVERLRPAPTFAKGDGYDDGRNLLGALLIGPQWDVLGYVVGRRGAWSAYSNAEWRKWTDRRRSLPLCQLAPRATVDDAAEALVQSIDRERAALAS